MTQAKQEQKLKETPRQEHIFRDFGGVNTQAFRTSIEDTEFSWLENLIPLGHGNLKAVYAQTAALATISPDICNYMQSANIGGISYVFLFCNSGAAYAIRTDTYVVTKFAPSATFSASGVQIAQWQNTYLLIIDPVNGYFSWDGTTLSSINGQVQSVVMSAYGTGYFHVPTVIFTPVSGGTGAHGTAIVGVATFIIAAGGTGYVVGDVITVSGGTPNTKASFNVTAVTAGAVSTITLNNQGDYTVAPASPVATTGGYGTGCTITIQWSVVKVNMTSAGTGYLSAPTISFTPTGGDTPTVVATATSTITVAPTAGTSIAVYSGRVWIANGRNVFFSAPNSFIDFTTANAGGSLILQDSTLLNKVNQLISANNYLYIFGDDSINIISDVRVLNGISLFNNTNLTAYVGSNISQSIQPYLRGIFFANQTGFYLIYGAVPQKLSDPLDGIMPYIDFTKPVTGGTVSIFNQLCMAFMFTYTGGATPRTLFAIFFNNKWFLASQGLNFTLCCPVFEDNKQEMYMTDGTSLYHAFKNASGAINTTIQTKLWDFGNSLITKQTLKSGYEVYSPLQAFSASLNIDTEIQSNTFNIGNTNLTSWINNLSTIVLWQNNSLATVSWQSAGFTYIMSDSTNYGKYIGYTLTSSSPSYTLNAMMLEYKDRARW